MSDFKRLIIEALVDKNHISILNVILGNLKTYFSERCTISESSQIGEPSGAVNIFFAIEGDMDFSDLEANSLELIKLNNLGCRVSFFDHLEKRTYVRHTKDALLYTHLETAPELPGPRQSSRSHEIRKTDGAPGSPWKDFATLCLVVILVASFYKAFTSRELPPPPLPIAVPSQSTSGLSQQNNARLTTSSPSLIQPFPNQIPHFNIPRFGVPTGNINVVNKKDFDQLQKIVREYRLSHTYSIADLFVCADMSIDVWNILKTKRINARIMAGRVDLDINNLNGLEYISNINHAWVVAEPQAGMAVPLETTGGFVVAPDKPNYRLYLEGLDFGNPRSFKEFIELRSRTFDICRQVQELENRFNGEFAGRPITQDSLVYKGRLDQKAQDCIGALSHLRDLLLQRN
jgi:hypothetical protein